MSRTQGTLPLHSSRDSKEKDPFAATRSEKVTFSDDALIERPVFSPRTDRFLVPRLKNISSGDR